MRKAILNFLMRREVLNARVECQMALIARNANIWENLKKTREL